MRDARAVSPMLPESGLNAKKDRLSLRARKAYPGLICKGASIPEWHQRTYCVLKSPRQRQWAIKLLGYKVARVAVNGDVLPYRRKLSKIQQATGTSAIYCSPHTVHSS